MWIILLVSLLKKHHQTRFLVKFTVSKITNFHKHKISTYKIERVWTKIYMYSKFNWHFTSLKYDELNCSIHLSINLLQFQGFEHVKKYMQSSIMINSRTFFEELILCIWLSRLSVVLINVKTSFIYFCILFEFSCEFLI